MTEAATGAIGSAPLRAREDEPVVTVPDATRLREPELGAPVAIDPLTEPSALLRTGQISERERRGGSARAALAAEVGRRHPGSDTTAIERAFDLGMGAHGEQRRKSGEPYFVHPVRVA